MNKTKCNNCKNNIPPPINDCVKHQESGAKTGELVKCFSLTGLSGHKDFYIKQKYKKKKWTWVRDYLLSH